jgi:hypothetical protein
MEAFILTMACLEGLTAHKDMALKLKCFHTFRWQQQSFYTSLTKWELWEIIVPYGKLRREIKPRGMPF